ncbi:MAG: nitroreductase [Chitinophagales bacterium]|nr:nitroreductase [Bacteroidota bacterium]MBP8752639.1 nitroreductase [Chitinophagales bacterium]
MKGTMQYNTEMINHLIRHRRTIKPAAFNKTTVSPEIIQQMLENARWAPTHALTQPWRFVVLSGEALQKFATLREQLYKESTPPEKFNENKFNKLSEQVLDSNYVILIGMHRQPTEKIPEWEEIAAVSCAVQNMQLTAFAYGVATFWSTGGMLNHASIKDFMALGEKDLCMGLLYVGNTDTEMHDVPRHPIEDVVQMHNK